MTGIIGKKIGMSQVIDENGDVVAVTYVSIEPNTITQVKTEEKDGYNAVVLGLEAVKKPTKTKKFKHVKEFHVEDPTSYTVGDMVNIESLKEVENISVSSVSKGKGFAGTIKRYNFSRGPMSHGSNFHRKPGSVGGCAFPGEVFKGKKLPGRMGNAKVTFRAKVVGIDEAQNLVAIKGPIPGANDALVCISIEQ